MSSGYNLAETFPVPYRLTVKWSTGVGGSGCRSRSRLPVPALAFGHALGEPGNIAQQENRAPRHAFDRY
jgi:hypothetical protein